MGIKSILALIVAYTATLFYIAAMCTPWWYTRYYPVGSSNSDFTAANPGTTFHSGALSRSNCFIDGSCITGGVIYKNNSNLQWVYTTVLVLMIVGWVPWLIFMHLLHFRTNKNRPTMKGRRVLMVITALLTMAFLLTSIIVFAAGITQNNGVYNSGGLYGSIQVPSNNYGSMPSGGRSSTLLGAGIPLLVTSTVAPAGVIGGGSPNFFGNAYNGPVNGTLGYKWGAHAAWYFAIVALALIPLALLLGLLLKVKDRVVTTTRTVERTVTTQPTVVPQQQFAPVGNRSL